MKRRILGMALLSLVTVGSVAGAGKGLSVNHLRVARNIVTTQS